MGLGKMFLLYPGLTVILLHLGMLYLVTLPSAHNVQVMYILELDKKFLGVLIYITCCDIFGLH